MINDEIFDIVMESEYEVINSMFDAYEKALVVLEEYDGDDLDSFSIFQEASMKAPEAPEKPKLSLRRTDKSGKKESIIKSIFAAIPRLIRHVQDLHKRRMQIKKMKKISKQASKLNVDISNMDAGEIELFHALMQRTISKKELEKFLRRRELKKALTKLGLKAGGAAIAIGGTAYCINKSGELIEEKVNDFKGKITKTLDESVLDPVRKAYTDAADKISSAADKACEKITTAANVCKEAMMKAINFIKKIYESIRKFFNINLLKYEQTSDESVLCKIDMKTGALHVTLDLDMWNEWLERSRIFLYHAAGLIAYKIDDKGGLHKNINDDGKSAKRVGLITDTQVNYNNSGVIKTTPDGKKLVADYMADMQKIANKSNSKKIYQPVDSFCKKAEAIADKLTKMCEVSNKLSDVYETRIKRMDDRNDAFVDVEKDVSLRIRGILDTQVQITNAISAVNEYIDDVAKMTESMSVTDDTNADDNE